MKRIFSVFMIFVFLFSIPVFAQNLTQTSEEDVALKECLKNKNCRKELKDSLKSEGNLIALKAIEEYEKQEKVANKYLKHSGIADMVGLKIDDYEEEKNNITYFNNYIKNVYGDINPLTFEQAIEDLIKISLTGDEKLLKKYLKYSGIANDIGLEEIEKR